ncbi:MAG: glycosyltransferase family 2 protein [Prevotella sp.]|nr:glycosyltransferase family 2 protein [Prevotella sp.]
MNKTLDYLKQERICVIVPTYNNAGTIVDVLKRIRAYAADVIVVNDGCTDDTDDRIAEAGIEGVHTVHLPHNEGKGSALRKGFHEAIRLGFRAAITIDADAQHYPEDLPSFAEAYRKNHEALIIGARTLDPNLMRKGSNFANRFSNFWFYVQTGLSLSDTQSGYRLYPLTLLNDRWIITSRYESELEFLVYAAWKGISITTIPVRVYYPPKDERVSSFRPVYDFMRITVLNVVLTALSFCYYYPVKLLRRIWHG